MKNLSILETAQVSGGVLCIQGICKIVPHVGVPDEYYPTLDNAYNLWLNDKIDYDKLDAMLAHVPWNFELQYINNKNKVFF